MNDDLRHDVELHDDDIRAFLARWRDPDPDAATQKRLITALKLIPLPSAHVAAAPMDGRARVRQAWLIMRAQTRVVGATTWMATVLMIALGVAVTLAFSSLDTSGRTFVLIAPMVAAFGIAFLYGDEIDPALEIQSALPVSPRVILLARLALVFGFDLLIAGVASVILALASAEITLLPLIASWLAPMTCLSALAFLASVLFFDPLMSGLLALTIWGAVVMRHIGELPLLARLPDVLTPEARPLLYILAAIGVVVGLMLSAREGHILRKDHA